MSRIIENMHFPTLGPPGRVDLLERLYPNGGTEKLTYGYLDRTEQPEGVIAADEQTLTRLGLTHEQVAKTIEDVFLHMPKNINGHPLIFWNYIHSPVCPWDDFCAVSPFDYSEKVTEVWLCNRKYYFKLRMLLSLLSKDRRLGRLKKFVANDWVMVLSDLHAHLIRDHRFFEGRSTPYRVDPERFIRFLGRENIHPYANRA